MQIFIGWTVFDWAHVQQGQLPPHPPFPPQHCWRPPPQMEAEFKGRQAAQMWLPGWSPKRCTGAFFKLFGRPLLACKRYKEGSAPKTGFSEFCISCLFTSWAQLPGRPQSPRLMIMYRKQTFLARCMTSEQCCSSRAAPGNKKGKFGPAQIGFGQTPRKYLKSAAGKYG
eukprot:1148550-Pelagomonas_calceolata.AAC.1